MGFVIVGGLLLLAQRLAFAVQEERDVVIGIRQAMEVSGMGESSSSWQMCGVTAQRRQGSAPILFSVC